MNTGPALEKVSDQITIYLLIIHKSGQIAVSELCPLRAYRAWPRGAPRSDTKNHGAAFSVTYPETFLRIRLRGISRSFKAAVAWVA